MVYKSSRLVPRVIFPQQVHAPDRNSDFPSGVVVERTDESCPLMLRFFAIQSPRSRPRLCTKYAQTERIPLPCIHFIRDTMRLKLEPECAQSYFTTGYYNTPKRHTLI